VTKDKDKVTVEVHCDGAYAFVVRSVQHDACQPLDVERVGKRRLLREAG
jgi:hypothetical protein